LVTEKKTKGSLKKNDKKEKNDASNKHSTAPLPTKEEEINLSNLIQQGTKLQAIKS